MSVIFILCLKHLEGCLTNDDCEETQFCNVETDTCEYCHPYGSENPFDCENELTSESAKQICSDSCRGWYFLA